MQFKIGQMVWAIGKYRPWDGDEVMHRVEQHRVVSCDEETACLMLWQHTIGASLTFWPLREERVFPSEEAAKAARDELERKEAKRVASVQGRERAEPLAEPGRGAGGGAG